MVQVAAALIWKDKKFMICQRPAHKSNALLWEFVGGKAEKGEKIEDALIRECREELDVKVKVKDIFYEVDHTYPDITIHLILFNAEIAEGEPKMLEHNDIKWISPEEIEKFNFCAADKDILKKIKEIML
ncbi:MAG: (deoxy)nucleoside triphosphate pyrophosphohydrolase [Ruminococcaceae bacterium]|nr:(deoxy)nucleoside triphosphate pyrophosphohydrolase [Oscillospiraceae bacterium]